MKLKPFNIFILIGILILPGLVLSGCYPTTDPIDELEESIIVNRPEEVEEIVEDSKKGWEEKDYQEIIDISDWINAEANFSSTEMFAWVTENSNYDHFEMMSDLEIGRALLTVINQEIETENNGAQILLKDYLFSLMTEEAQAYAGFYPKFEVEGLGYHEGFPDVARFLEIIKKEVAETVITEIAPYFLPPGINVIAVGIIKVYGVYSKYNQVQALEEALQTESYSKALNQYFQNKVVWGDPNFGNKDWKGYYKTALGISSDAENYEELIEVAGDYFEELFNKYKPYTEDGWQEIDGVSIDREQIRKETAKLIVYKLEEEFIDN